MTHFAIVQPRNNLLGSFVLSLALIAASSVAFAKSAPDSFADLAEELLPSVVNISTTQVIEGRSGMELPKLPQGSPFEDFFQEGFDRHQPDQRSRRATPLVPGSIVDAAGDIGSTHAMIQV